MVVGRRCQPISVGMRSLPVWSNGRISSRRPKRKKEESRGRPTEPVVDERLVHGACSTIGHDLKERGALSPAETIGKTGEREVRIRPLRSRQPSHASVSDLLNSNHIGGEVGCCLGPDCLVGRIRTFPVGIGRTVPLQSACHYTWVDSIPRHRLHFIAETYLRLISCSKIPWRPRSSRLKLSVRG